MARTITEINNATVAAYVTYMAAIGVTIDPTQWSRRNLQRVMLFTVASAIAIFEQIQDLYYAKQEALIATAPAATKAWLQSMVLKFQYDASDPQIIQLDPTTMSYFYPVVDEDLRIITRVAVIQTMENFVNIKVAKSEPPEALDVSEVAALQGYVNTIGIAGVVYNVTSAPADRIYLGMDLYYQGQYASVILDNVVNGINAFLSGIPFNGVMRLTDLEIAIKNIAGVNDVVLKNIKARADATPFGSATVLVNDGTELQRQWATFAGYMLTENESGETPADSINLIAE